MMTILGNSSETWIVMFWLQHLPNLPTGFDRNMDAEKMLGKTNDSPSGEILFPIKGFIQSDSISIEFIQPFSITAFPAGENRHQRIWNPAIKSLLMREINLMMVESNHI